MLLGSCNPMSTLDECSWPSFKDRTPTNNPTFKPSMTNSANKQQNQCAPASQLATAHTPFTQSAVAWGSLHGAQDPQCWGVLSGVSQPLPGSSLPVPQPASNAWCTSQQHGRSWRMLETQSAARGVRSLVQSQWDRNRPPPAVQNVVTATRCTEPSLPASATVCHQPALICLKTVSPNTLTGAYWLALVPSPSSPWTFSPASHPFVHNRSHCWLPNHSFAHYTELHAQSQLLTPAEGLAGCSEATIVPGASIDVCEDGSTRHTDGRRAGITHCVVSQLGNNVPSCDSARAAHIRACECVSCACKHGQQQKQEHNRLPQQKARPDTFSMAHVWVAPALICEKLKPPATLTGVFTLPPVVPFPSRPNSLLPAGQPCEHISECRSADNCFQHGQQQHHATAAH